LSISNKKTEAMKVEALIINVNIPKKIIKYKVCTCSNGHQPTSFFIGINWVLVMYKDEIFVLSKSTKHSTSTRIIQPPFLLLLLVGVGRDWVNLVYRPPVGLLYQPWIADKYGAVGKMRIGKGNRSILRKPVPVPLCPRQIPHDLTRTTAARNRRPTTELWHSYSVVLI
jgi:hypothetical protein